MIGAILSWIASSRLGRAIAAALALLAAGAVIFSRVKAGAIRRERERHELEERRRDYEIRRRMDHADTGAGDPDADRDWLRDRASNPRP